MNLKSNFRKLKLLIKLIKSIFSNKTGFDHNI